MRGYYQRNFVLFVMLSALLVLTIFGLVLYDEVGGIIERQLGINARGVAMTTAELIMDDIELYEDFMENRDVTSRYYQNMQLRLARIKEVGEIQFIFTERRLDKDTIEYILDAEAPGSEDYSPPGSLGPNDWKREQVYSNRQPANFRMYDHPRWGRIIAAYAPLFAADGRFLGLAGVNISAERVFAKLSALVKVMIVTVAFLVSVIFIFLVKFSGLIFGPLVTDKLTGAYNRRYFEKYIHEEMDNAAKGGIGLSILMLDIDHFKQINDNYGHGFGDKVLVDVCGLINDSLRKDDALFRYGGEEFVIVLPHTSLEIGLMIAESIRKMVESFRVFSCKGDMSIGITVSIGVAQTTGASCTVEEIMARADKAMYDAKTQRNMVRAYEAEA